MPFPWRLSWALARYLAACKLRGVQRFPLVLMLEPTFRCNLSCAGCGRIRADRELRGRVLSADECLAAVAEAGAPVVSLTGGEPLLHPQIAEIVARIVAGRRFVHLCTNGVALAESLSQFEPSPYLSFVVHLDGLAATHDGIVGQPGVFDRAIAAVEAAKRSGFQVRTNTTLFKGTSPEETVALFTLLTDLGVDGMMVAPAFSYDRVTADIFPSAGEAAALFQPLYRARRRFRLYHTPLYLEFLAGKRPLPCTPWSTPTRNPKGWQRPCYLIADGYCASFRELLQATPWERYGVGRDPRCHNCLMHCGFEASAIAEAGRRPWDLWRLVRWSCLGI